MKYFLQNGIKNIIYLYEKNKEMMKTERKILLINLEILIFIVFNTSASLYVTDIQMNKMIELTIRKPHCRIIVDRGSIQQVVLSMDSLKIRQVPIETIHTLEKVCIEGNQLSSEIQGLY